VTGALTVSVALCTYNGERFMREQLQSILGQTVPPAELVVSDDGSSDRTLQVVREVVAEVSKAPRMTILENARPLGVAGNFTRAIEACTSDLVVLSDQDDVWRSDRIERLVTAFTESPDLVLLHGDADLIDGSDAPLGASLFDALGVTSAVQQLVHDGGAFELLLRRNIVTGATTGFRRTLATVAFPVPEGWLHDEWLAIVGAATARIDLTTERLVEYRQHGENEIGVRKLSVVGKFRRMIEPGSERSARLLRRASSLVDRLADSPDVAQVRRNAITEKLAHERARSALSEHRLLRLVPVLRELQTGRYSRFGRGPSDAVRDLLQPLRDRG
jgi:glycosyltransferase involved in cell wall biosynthesis